MYTFFVKVFFKDLKIKRSLFWSNKFLYFQMYKRAEQNFVLSNEIDNMSLIMPSTSKQVNVNIDPGLETKKQSG